MRNTAICFVATLCLLATAAGQNPVQHAWKVVQVVQLIKQTVDTPVTTLFTPAKIGFYRVTFLVACGGAGKEQIPVWMFEMTWGKYDTSTSCSAGVTAAPAVFPISPQVGIPVSYSVTAEQGAPTFAYDLYLTIEQFQ